MKNVIINDELVSVELFEDKSNKKYPYYYNGGKYAICPYCKSSVRIVNGGNNSIKSKQRGMYAAHTERKINDELPFNNQYKEICLYYEGNKNNWQQIYNSETSNEKNSMLEEYIKNNRCKISKEIGDILGIKCSENFFEKIYNSFEKNGGLSIKEIIAEYIPRQIIFLAGPISCWGHVVKEDTKNRILENTIFDIHSFNDFNQLKPNISDSIEIVGVLDNDQNPQYILVKLCYTNNNEIVIKRVPAKVLII